MLSMKSFYVVGLCSLIQTTAFALDPMYCSGTIGEKFAPAAKRFDNKLALESLTEAEYRGISISTSRSGYGGETRVVVRIRKDGPNGFEKIVEASPKSLLVVNEFISMGPDQSGVALHVSCGPNQK